VTPLPELVPPVLRLWLRDGGRAPPWGDIQTIALPAMRSAPGTGPGWHSPAAARQSDEQVKTP